MSTAGMKMKQIAFMVLDAALWSAMIAAGLSTSLTMLWMVVTSLPMPRQVDKWVSALDVLGFLAGPTLTLLSVLVTGVGFLIKLRFLPRASQARLANNRDRLEGFLRRMCWFGTIATILGIAISGPMAASLLLYPHGPDVFAFQDFLLSLIVCFGLVAALGWFLRRKARLVLDSLASTSPQQDTH